MRQVRKGRAQVSAQPAAANEVRAQPVDPFGTGSGVTGRYIVTFAETDSDAAVRTVLKFGGAKMAVSTARDDLAAANVPDSGVYFDRLGIAVVNVDPVPRAHSWRRVPPTPASCRWSRSRSCMPSVQAARYPKN